MTAHNSIHPTLAEKLEALMDSAGVTVDRDLTSDMLQAVLKLARDQPGRGEMKLMARSYKELRYAFKVFKPYRARRKVSIFGSARTPADSPNYRLAVEFARRCAQAGFMIITGAGGGIMAAGHEGGGAARSFGVAIRLPAEQRTNPHIEKDEKLIHFRYFFSRKLVFVKETHAIALFPGGFGTHDEGFEVLTLVQTGRADPLPIVLLEAPGGAYWQEWDRFIKGQVLREGLISPEDVSLYFITSDAQAATEHICRFYRNYHSCRYQGGELYLRVRHAPTPAELADLNARFADIVTGGAIAVGPAETGDEDALVPAYPRIVLRFDRQNFARLRQLIDALNALPSLPAGPEPRPADTQGERSDRHVGEITEEESLHLVDPKTAPPGHEAESGATSNPSPGPRRD